MTLYLWTLLLTLATLFLRALLHAYWSPLRTVPGPLLARFSRFWLLRAYMSRSFHETNRSLHGTYGMHLSGLVYTTESFGDPADGKV